MPRVLPILPAARPATSVGLPAIPSRRWQGTRDHVPARQEPYPAWLLPQGIPTSLSPTAVFSLMEPFPFLFFFFSKKKKKSKANPQVQEEQKKDNQAKAGALYHHPFRVSLTCPQLPPHPT